MGLHPSVADLTSPSGKAGAGWRRRTLSLAAGGALVLALVSIGVAWNAAQRLAGLERELVLRQQESAGQSSEARLLAKQAQEGMLEGAAKVALLEARLAEVALQRGQLEELLQSLSRSRDENMIVDIEAAIRVATQHNAITGSAEPLVAALRQSDERLLRHGQPKFEGVRRAIARDLDRVRAAGVADLSTLTIRIDEAIRLVDELVLLSSVESRRLAPRALVAPKPVAPASAPGALAWTSDWSQNLDAIWQRVLLEARSLVRVTAIDQPEAMLLAPEQAFFLKENLKLRLLNARLALLSRQFETAQSDLAGARSSLERYFDRNSKRTALAIELVKQVSTQARQVAVPRPDDTLAALAAAGAGR